MPKERWSTGRRALYAAAVLLIVYVGALALLVSQETALVFQAGRPLGEARPPFPFEQVSIDRPDRARQFAWTMRGPAGSDTWVLFLHGNSATIASRVNIARYAQLRALGLHVFAPEYRGFGGLDGVPTEATLAADARAAYEHLRQRLRVPADRIVIYGWSLGSAVAVATAATLPQAAVILEGAPASLVDIGQQQYPFFPIRLVMRNRFESIASIDRIHSPLLFLHSPEDVVIPISEGRRLYEAARAPKRFVEVRGGHIYANDVDRVVFDDAIRAFLGGLGLIATEGH